MLVNSPTRSFRDRPGRLHLAAVGPAAVDLAVEVVIPVYNEVHVLERSVLRLRRHLDAGFPYPAVVTVADNASTDGTWEAARQLARTVPGVRAVRIPEQGRGRALAAVWSASSASILAYMDVDLSTDLAALLPLIASVASGHSEVAIGSRLMSGARVGRGAAREIISRAYNQLIRLAVGRRFTDAQCGFKALSAEAAAVLLPQVRDGGWFFDTELLLLAASAGMRIHEIPVDWMDDPDSRVRIVSTAWSDLRGLARVSGRTILRRASLAVSGAAGIAALAALLSGMAGPATGSALAVLIAAAAFHAVRTAGRVRRRASRLERATGPRPARLSVVGPGPEGGADRT